MEANLSPLAALFERPMVVIAGQSGTMSSPAGGATGISRASISSRPSTSQIEPYPTMLGMLPPTGPWLWNGPTFGWVVDGLAAANETITLSVMYWRGIEGYVGGAGSDYNLGVVTYFNVDAAGTSLVLQGGAELAVGEESSKVALWAALDAWDQANRRSRIARSSPWPRAASANHANHANVTASGWRQIRRSRRPPRGWYPRPAAYFQRCPPPRPRPRARLRDRSHLP